MNIIQKETPSRQGDSNVVRLIRATNISVNDASTDTPEWRETIFKAAIAYFEDGYIPIPLMSGKKKCKPCRLGKKAHGGVFQGRSYAEVAAEIDEDTIKEWFDPDTGRFAGHNIGIITGGHGPTVIDLDRKHGCNGASNLHEYLAAEAADDEWDGNLTTWPGPVQHTPSGGYHLLAQPLPGARCAQNTPAGCVDIRASTAGDKPGGHIVVWPSFASLEIGGAMVQYRWAAGEGGILTYERQLPDLMEIAPRLAEAITERSRAHGRGSGPVTHLHPPGYIKNAARGQGEDDTRPVPLADFKKWLDTLDAYSEGDWSRACNMGASLIVINGNAEDTIREAIHAWASQAADSTGSDGRSLYEEDDTDKRIDRAIRETRNKHLQGESIIGAGTLYHELKETDDPVQELLTEWALIKLGPECLPVRIKSDGEGKPYILKKPALRLKYENRKVLLPDHKKPINPADVWAMSPSRRDFDGMGMYPPPAACPDNYLNLWNGFPHGQGRPGDISPLLRVLQEWVANEPDNTRDDTLEWMLDWFAHLFQRPGEKPGSAIVVRGPQGCGKNAAANAFTEALGNFALTENDSKRIIGKYNVWMINTLLLVANESVLGMSGRAGDALKGIITEKMHTIEEKNVPTFISPTYTRVIILTNHEASVPADAGSRRYLALHSGDSLVDARGFWKEYHQWLDGPDAGPAITDFFLTREITHDVRVPPRTGELVVQEEAYQVRQAEKMGQEWLWLACLMEHCPTIRKIGGLHDGELLWRNADIKTALEENGHKWSSMAMRGIRNALKKAGAGPLKIGVLVRFGESKSRCTILPESPAAIISALKARHLWDNDLPGDEWMNITDEEEDIF